MNNHETTVLEALRQLGKPAKGAEVAAAAGMDPKEVGKILSSLKKSGEVVSPKMCFYAPAK